MADNWNLKFLDKSWIGDPKYSFLAIIIVAAWGAVGYLMIIYMAALQGVPTELKSAASLDGANAWQIFWKVTFPLIGHAVTICIFWALNSGFQVFDVIYALTGGGPGRATQSAAINIYEDSFQQFVGTMFHYLLSRIYNKDFNLDIEWNNYLKDKSFSKKEQFYLRDLKKEFENILKVLKYQYSLTGLTSVELEKQITINYSNNCTLTGIIDKIMFKEKDNNTYIAIVDYKTGTPNINISNLLYGLDMQLPIYVYLTLKSNMFDNPKIIGFYLEKILHDKSSSKDLDKQNIDNLKLMGYTIDDQYLVSILDSSYENSDMIKGMKITSKGFAHYSKVLSENSINKLANIVEDKVKDAFNNILNGEFKINPKIINGKNLGCEFCKYNDLCFKTGKDFVYLKEEEDLSFLED